MTARQEWLAFGRVEVPAEAIEPGLWEALEKEAEALWPYRMVRHNQRPGLLAMRDGSITSPQRCTVHVGGEALRAIATAPDLAAAACEATGHAAMTPIRYGLKWYEPGDYMHVHRDDGKCQVTFSAGLTPGLAPMGWLPHLRWLTTQQVTERLTGTPYPDGEDFPIRHRRFTGFDGSRIPHWRAPLDSTSREVLVTVCFADLTV
ncbi:hypothetical protein ACWDBD_36995 [Streptomyces sp. NPDC001118]